MLRILLPALALIRKFAVLAALPGLLAAASPAAAQEWAVDKANTQISFEGIAGGQIVSGLFRQYQIEVHFDPEEPGDADLVAAIDLNSISTGNPDVDRALRSPEWFNTATYPVASFRAVSIESTGDDQFEMRGDLTIKGTTKRVSVPFSLDVQQGDGLARAEIVLSRSAFRLGPPGPVAGMVVSDQVRVVITAAGKRLDN